MPERRRLRVTGTVQGVGFRPFVYRQAVDLQLAGYVGNDSEGVVIEVEGTPEHLDELCRRLQEEPPPLAHVHALESTTVPAANGDDFGVGDFRIVDSRVDGAPAVAVSVDVATCADCLRELRDPSDRRHGYPFTNCTNCGPRYTIIRSIPYDRASTTMAGFTMCEACRSEYEDPADRRFHAEPNACPLCGPQLRLLAPEPWERPPSCWSRAASSPSRGWAAITWQPTPPIPWPWPSCAAGRPETTSPSR